MALAIVLAGEGFATDCTHEWSFVGVGAEMRAQVVCSSKPLRTQSALESGGVLLDTLRVTRSCTRAPWVSQIENIVTTLDRRCRKTSIRP